jgi:hypothetical protein
MSPTNQTFGFSTISFGGGGNINVFFERSIQQHEPDLGFNESGLTVGAMAGDRD